MCGIIGIISQNHQQAVNQSIVDALTMIQHRGQDAAGVATFDGEQIHTRKSAGLVRDVVHSRHMRQLQGYMGVGHVRYPTAGSDSVAEAQPFYVNSPYGLSIVHNGNLVNTEQLHQDVIEKDLRHLNTQSDSELLLNVFAYELQQAKEKQFSVPELFAALKRVYARIQGAYSVIILIAGQGILAFRDPDGIRPLIYGRREQPGGPEYLFASESVVFNAMGFTLTDDVAPGEAIFVDQQGQVHRDVCATQVKSRPCLFEYIYLARPDSTIDGISVYQARINMGRALAEKIQSLTSKPSIDVVIPVPDTSCTAALALAQRLELPYSEGLVKNRYIARTFIMPGQRMRRHNVRLKLNAIAEEFHGKNVLLVDDSIVRGTTSREIIQLARNAGAKQVYFASAAPPIKYPNVYGIDMPCANELIATQGSIDAVGQLIGADWLVYQELDAVIAAVRRAQVRGHTKITQFEDSVFTGNYITGGVDVNYFLKLERQRNDLAKQQRGKKSDAEVAG